jgi:saccharopine dehydrogenase-like NADP-dependent oxidoreductase
MEIFIFGAGAVGCAAAYDMLRSGSVSSITLADHDGERVNHSVCQLQNRTGINKISPLVLEAGDVEAVIHAMHGHDGVLSALPGRMHAAAARAAILGGCHFVDVGDHDSTLSEDLVLHELAAEAGIAVAPDCGLSPGVAAVAGTELLLRLGGKADSLKIYCGHISPSASRPFFFEPAEHFFGEYNGDAVMLRAGRPLAVEAMSGVETVHLDGLPDLEAYFRSSSKLPLAERFADGVEECFEKELQVPGYVARLRALCTVGQVAGSVPPKVHTSAGFWLPDADWTAAPNHPDEVSEVTILHTVAQYQDVLASFSMVGSGDPESGINSRACSVAWPASIVLQMLIMGEIDKAGLVRPERDIPAQRFFQELASRGLALRYRIESARAFRQESMAVAREN